MSSSHVVVVLFALFCLGFAGRITGPIVFSTYNPQNPPSSISLVLPNTIDGVVNDTANWAPLSACITNLGRLTWANRLLVNMTDINNDTRTNYPTFGAFYNSNGKLSGYVHATLSNLSYDYGAFGFVYWIKINAGSGHPLFDYPVDQWIHVIHLENVTNLCNGQGMAKTYSGAGDVVLLNQPPELGGTPRRFPYNKTDARNSNFGHPPTGDECVPMMGCHWFDRDGGAPIYPQWVAGYDVYGELQFTELMTTTKQPISGTQWELIPAGTLPAFGNIDWYFRHVHVKSPMDGCVNVCAQNRDDCHSTATCAPDFSQAPFFRCTCPNVSTIVTFNNGRGANGCSTCPLGKVPSVDRRLCIDACSTGYVADENGACQDVNDCASTACAADETCVNLMGTPSACVFTQVAPVAQSWTDFIASKNASALSQIVDSSLVMSFTLGKRAELILTLANPEAVTDSDVAQNFASASASSLVAYFDAKQRLIVKLTTVDSINTVDAKNNAVAVVLSLAATLFAAVALLF